MRMRRCLRYASPHTHALHSQRAYIPVGRRSRVNMSLFPSTTTSLEPRRRQKYFETVPQIVDDTVKKACLVPTSFPLKVSLTTQILNYDVLFYKEKYNLDSFS